LYYKNATIFFDKEKQKEFDNNKSLMMQFFESDSRVMVKMQIAAAMGKIKENEDNYKEL